MSKTTKNRKPRQRKPVGPMTLAVDIGGTGLKMMVLDAHGKPVTDRERVETPRPATPQALLDQLDVMRAAMPEFDRVSVGFPGVVKRGVTMTAFNLDPKWAGYDLREALAKRWKKPVRVANDAAVQGYGAIRGQGVELVLTLGTGLGSSLFTDGRLCPGLELGHHPWRKGKTYEEYLGQASLRKVGKKRWNKWLQLAIRQIEKLFNYDFLYIGGGNSLKINFELPRHARIRLKRRRPCLGGVALWRHD